MSDHATQKGTPRLGRLRNGGQAAPVSAANAAPRCNAKTRRGTLCQLPAIRGKRRCRLHGGKSTGPRTAEGKARCQEGRRRAAAIRRAKRDAERRPVDELANLLAAVGELACDDNTAGDDQRQETEQ